MEVSCVVREYVLIQILPTHACALRKIMRKLCSKFISFSKVLISFREMSDFL